MNAERSSQPAQPRAGRDAWLARFSRRSTAGRELIPEIDGLRFVAIALVLLVHTVNATAGVLSQRLWASSHGGAQLHTGLDPAVARSDFLSAAQGGSYGVHLFFIISGFILALPFASHRLRGGNEVRIGRYYFRRLTRLEPPYLVALLLAYVASGVVIGTLRSHFPNLLASIPYLHGIIPGGGNPDNVVLWSLEVEVQFYVLVPVLTLLFVIRPKVTRRMVLIVLMVLVALAQSLFLDPTSKWADTLPNYLQYFLLGFLFADLYLLGWRDSSPTKKTVFDLLGVVGLVILPFSFALGPPIANLLGPVAVGLIFLAGFRGRATNRLVRVPWIYTIGGMCYSIYLVHTPLLMAMSRFTPHLLVGSTLVGNVLVQGVIMVAVIFLCAAVFFLLVERPCMDPEWPQKVWAWLRRRPDRATA